MLPGSIPSHVQAALDAPFALRSSCAHSVYLLQDVRAGTAVTKRFHSIMQQLVDGMRRERPAESSIAAHLLDIKDPKTGISRLCIRSHGKKTFI